MADPTWGYSADDARIFDDGVLPSGYYDNPAKVPGSDAQKAYVADCERDGAPIPDWAKTKAHKQTKQITLDMPPVPGAGD